MYYICILDLGNFDKTKSKFEQFSYSISKWVVKQQRQFATSTTHLAQELLMLMQCTGGSRSFAKETSLEDEEGSGWTSEVNNNQLRASSKSILLQSQEKLLNNSTSAILQSFGI